MLKPETALLLIQRALQLDAGNCLGMDTVTGGLYLLVFQNQSRKTFRGKTLMDIAEELQSKLFR